VRQWLVYADARKDDLFGSARNFAWEVSGAFADGLTGVGRGEKLIGFLPGTGSVLDVETHALDSLRIRSVFFLAGLGRPIGRNVLYLKYFYPQILTSCDVDRPAGPKPGSFYRALMPTSIFPKNLILPDNFFLNLHLLLSFELHLIVFRPLHAPIPLRFRQNPQKNPGVCFDPLFPDTIIFTLTGALNIK
jgi:hypothetical protein